MKEFISSNEIVMLKFYGIIIRINVVFVDEQSTLWIVTKRTCNKRDEETWLFRDFNDSKVKFKQLVSEIKTFWGADIANSL